MHQPCAKPWAQLALPTSAPGLGPPLPTSAPGLCTSPVVPRCVCITPRLPTTAHGTARRGTPSAGAPSAVSALFVACTAMAAANSAPEPPCLHQAGSAILSGTLGADAQSTSIQANHRIAVRARANHASLHAQAPVRAHTQPRAHWRTRRGELRAKGKRHGTALQHIRCSRADCRRHAREAYVLHHITQCDLSCRRLQLLQRGRKLHRGARALSYVTTRCNIAQHVAAQCSASRAGGRKQAHASTLMRAARTRRCAQAPAHNAQCTAHRPTRAAAHPSAARRALGCAAALVRVRVHARVCYVHLRACKLTRTCPLAHRHRAGSGRERETGANARTRTHARARTRTEAQIRTLRLMRHVHVWSSAA
jgi:hypothetical protein